MWKRKGASLLFSCSPSLVVLFSIVYLILQFLLPPISSFALSILLFFCRYFPSNAAFITLLLSHQKQLLYPTKVGIRFVYILPSQDPTRESTMDMLLFAHSVLLINTSFPLLDEYLIYQPASLLWVPSSFYQ